MYTEPVTVTAECPMATTAIAGTKNGIEGCGFGCTTMDTIQDCRDACDAQSGCVSFSWNADSSQCALYDSDTPTVAINGNQIMCTVNGMPQCTIECDGWDAYLSGDPHFSTWHGVKHNFQGAKNKDGQQFYFMTPCDHNDRHYQPFSILGKQEGWYGSGGKIGRTGLTYLTLELYDEWDTYYVFFSAAIRKYVHAAEAVSSLYDENTAAGVAMDTFYAGDTIVANGKFKLSSTNNPGQNPVDLTLTHIPTGCTQKIHMQHSHSSGSTRYHYVRWEKPECYKCTTCGLLGV